MSLQSYIAILGFALLSALAPAQVPQAASSQLDPTLLELPAIGAEDVILAYDGFALSYNPERLIPNWVAYELTADELGGEVPRARGFSMDPGYPGRQAMREDYSNSGWDKGHMAPSADMKWSQEAMAESFYLTNICPQDPTLNGRDWHALENRVRAWAERYGRVWVVCGPIVRENQYGTIGERSVACEAMSFGGFGSPNLITKGSRMRRRSSRLYPRVLKSADFSGFIDVSLIAGKDVPLSIITFSPRD